VNKEGTTGLGETIRFGISIDDKLLDSFDRLIETKGVKHGKLVMTTSGEELH
jgi:metal-responsive CopG/Arc/MetJ family transcriptional regulator